MVDFIGLLMPYAFYGGCGLLGGILIGSLGYVKAGTTTADKDATIIDKLTNADFKSPRFLTTVAFTGLMGILVGMLLFAGVPSDILLAVCSAMAFRDSGSDLLKILSSLTSSTPQKK